MVLLIPTPGAMELGEHQFSYSVHPYVGDWRSEGVYTEAYEFSQSLAARQVNSDVSTDAQWISVEPDNLIVSAVKRAEDGDALILRFFETKGEATRAEVRLPKEVAFVSSVNLIEQEDEPLSLNNGLLELDVGAFEIITLKLVLK